MAEPQWRYWMCPGGCRAKVATGGTKGVIYCEACHLDYVEISYGEFNGGHRVPGWDETHHWDNAEAVTERITKAMDRRDKPSAGLTEK